MSGRENGGGQREVCKSREEGKELGVTNNELAPKCTACKRECLIGVTSLHVWELVYADGATKEGCGASFDRSHELGARPKKLNLYRGLQMARTVGEGPVRVTVAKYEDNYVLLCLRRLEDTSSEAR